MANEISIRLAQLKDIVDNIYICSREVDNLRAQVKRLTDDVFAVEALVEERTAQRDEARRMLDITRHRVLRALGESDRGKSWNWIEDHLAEKEEGDTTEVTDE